MTQWVFSDPADPARLLRIASATAVIASSWPTTLLCSSSSRFNKFFSFRSAAFLQPEYRLLLQLLRRYLQHPLLLSTNVFQYCSANCSENSFNYFLLLFYFAVPDLSHFSVITFPFCFFSFQIFRVLNFSFCLSELFQPVLFPVSILL